MKNILALQGMDVSFIDVDGPLSGVPECFKTSSMTSLTCSTSSNGCDVAGMGEHYF